MGFVQRPQLAQQHAERPTVCDDVVKRQQQYVLAGTQVQQGRTHQRRATQIEGELRVQRSQACHLSLACCLRCQPFQADHPQRHAASRCDDLHRLPFSHSDGRAQRFVATGERGETRLQRRHVERPGQPHGIWNGVEGAARRQLLDEPDTLLREREWKGEHISVAVCDDGLGCRRASP